MVKVKRENDCWSAFTLSDHFKAVLLSLREPPELILVRLPIINILCFQVCSLEFDRKDISMNKLVATSLEGKFHVFDMRTQHPTKGFASVSEKVNMREMSLYEEE